MVRGAERCIPAITIAGVAGSIDVEGITGFLGYRLRKCGEKREVTDLGSLGGPLSIANDSQ